MSESQAQPAEVATARRVPGWAKPARVMLGAMAVSAAAFLTTLPTWIRAEVSTVVSTSTLDISGADAGPTVSALALVALVASVALRIAGPKLCKVLSLLIASMGVGITLAAFNVALDPQSATMAQVSAITGTNAPAHSYEVTSLPYLAIVAGGLVVLAGLWALLATSFWKVGQKYDRSAARVRRLSEAESPDEIDTWDSLSEGKDPTE